MAGSAIGFRGVWTANRDIGGIADPTVRANEFQRLSGMSAHLQTGLQNYGQGSQGMGSVLQGVNDASATSEEAEKQAADKAATAYDAAHEQATNMKQQYLAVLQDYLDKAKSREQSRDQVAMQLARNV